MANEATARLFERLTPLVQSFAIEVAGADRTVMMDLISTSIGRHQRPLTYSKRLLPAQQRQERTSSYDNRVQFMG